eukprot:1330850-Amorphochlora_amoeboformis.AAC.1
MGINRSPSFPSLLEEYRPSAMDFISTLPPPTGDISHSVAGGWFRFGDTYFLKALVGFDCRRDTCLSDLLTIGQYSQDENRADKGES